MRRRIGLLLVGCLLLSLLTGCGMWTEGNYYSVQEYQENSVPSQPGNLSVDTFDGLCTALTDIIREAVESCTLNIPSIPQNAVTSWIEQAIEYVMVSDAMGAYCVEEISYEVGASGGNAAVAVDITYNRTRAEILRISKAQDMDEAYLLITEKLNNCDTGAVMLIDHYEQVDFPQMVEDYANRMPDMVMEVPQVIAAVYPEEGTQRLVELIFTYTTSRDDLRAMQQSVAPVFTSAELYVSGNDDPKEKFEQLYSFLMERTDYVTETSITPAYSLLHHGVGDCQAFANIYAAMCRRAGLDCEVISGTRNGEAWFWNMIRIGEEYFYVDLLYSSQNRSFLLRKDSEMRGYVWDYSAHPAAV